MSLTLCHAKMSWKRQKQTWNFMTWGIKKFNYANLHVTSCHRRTLFFTDHQRNSQIFRNRTYVSGPKTHVQVTNMLNIVKAWRQSFYPPQVHTQPYRLTFLPQIFQPTLQIFFVCKLTWHIFLHHYPLGCLNLQFGRYWSVR